VTPAVAGGWHLVRLQAPPTNKSFSEDNTGKVPCSYVLLHLWRMPGLTQLKPKVVSDWPTNSIGTKPCPEWAESHCRWWDWRQKQLSHNSRAQATHIGETPEAPGSGEQEIMHCRALQNLFFIRPLLPRAGDTADIPNTEKQTQR